MMFAFLSVEFNGRELLKSAKEIPRCGKCGWPIDKWSVSVDDKTILKSDISSSADGFIMVSPKFKAIYEGDALEGCSFRELPNGHFVLVIHRAIQFDEDTLNLTKRGKCDACGKYEEMFGAANAPKIAAQEPLIKPTEIVRSHLEYPLLIDGVGGFYKIIVGDRVREVFLASGFGAKAFQKISDS